MGKLRNLVCALTMAAGFGSMNVAYTSTPDEKLRQAQSWEALGHISDNGTVKGMSRFYSWGLRTDAQGQFYRESQARDEQIMQQQQAIQRQLNARRNSNSEPGLIKSGLSDEEASRYLSMDVKGIDSDGDDKNTFLCEEDVVIAFADNIYNPHNYEFRMTDKFSGKVLGEDRAVAGGNKWRVCELGKIEPGKYTFFYKPGNFVDGNKGVRNSGCSADITVLKKHGFFSEMYSLGDDKKFEYVDENNDDTYTPKWDIVTNKNQTRFKDGEKVNFMFGDSEEGEHYADFKVYSERKKEYVYEDRLKMTGDGQIKWLEIEGEENMGRYVVTYTPDSKTTSGKRIYSSGEDRSSSIIIEFK